MLWFILVVLIILSIATVIVALELFVLGRTKEKDNKDVSMLHCYQFVSHVYTDYVSYIVQSDVFAPDYEIAVRSLYQNFRSQGYWIKKIKYYGMTSNI